LLLTTVATGQTATTPRQPYESFKIATPNEPQAQIAGWFLPASRARGTLILCHGFGASKSDWLPYQWIRDSCHWNVIMFDFREHGESTNAWGQVRTLGYYEIWDVKAVVDWAESRHLARQLALYGVSMGGSVALRWAGEGQDHRIVGVLADSPYRSGWDAIQQFQYHAMPLGPLGPTLLHGGFKQMMQQVDIPAALSKRDDLIVWLTWGENDWFPPEDQSAIAAAVRSPESLKHVEILPGVGHAQGWMDPARNDQKIKSFLALCESRNGHRATLLQVVAAAVAACVIFACIALWLIRRRNANEDAA
jgi:pimeloyl-ACP methyl ester carboxylesterase